MMKQLTCISLLAIAGCGLIKIEMPESPKPDPAMQAYHGPECNKDSWNHEALEDQVLIRACHTPHGHHALPRAWMEGGLAKRHRTFDDRHVDQVAVAFSLIDCNLEPECKSLPLGITTLYADMLDARALQARLAPLNLPNEAKTVFAQRAVDAVAGVRTKAAALDPRRKHMYVDVPHEVVAQRRAYFTENAAAYQALDQLEARAAQERTSKQVSQQTIDGLVALRGDYIDRHPGEAHRFDPFVIETTREIVLLHIVANDELSARAENDLLTEPAAGRHLFSVETGTAVYKAMEEESRAYSEYNAAKDHVDAATLSARFGATPPVHIDPSRDYIGEENLPNLTSLFAEKSRVTSAGGIVKSVTDAGRKNAKGQPIVQVLFRDNVREEDMTNCRETGRVSGVSYDSAHHAKLEYETICNVVGTKTIAEKVPSVFVPKAETLKLQPGESLTALIDTTSREGVIVQSRGQRATPKGTTPVLQFRAHRIAQVKQ